MKLKLGRFIAAFYAFFLLMEVLRELLRSSKYVDQFVSEPWDMTLLVLQSSVLFLAYAICTYLYLYYQYQKRAKWFHVLAVFAIALGIIGLRYLVEEVIIKSITGYGNYYEGTTAYYYIADNLYYAILYTLFGVAYFFIFYGQFKERRQRQLELENKKTELSFLRSQVNPHFLFNMLNNIYSLINMGSDKALLATDRLSKLLRYSLYESDEMVTVEHEVQSIHDYIALQELRFRESVQTTITLDPQSIHHKILPFVLMPLVENAFKHGEVTDANHPVRIAIKAMGEYLDITISNKIADKNKDEVGGIGVENLEKRLQLTYGDRHVFERNIEDGQFIIHIKLPTQ
ncbi:hypothetical protein BST97_11515 [Nonlabens spongiae]|uniref:Signal transduction histidine kinase internal region domain-containing protein n=1 Tax=Nonlabens spongiae TaxID=331648 RepID=A0A1W6MLU3_9FLAO|nr:histidine kinase [Nonlabens spongiae]ARN78563.1 hypothetical protein BST97_11515 [Nonlabens spongiae]